jgi:hypothetical protein
MRVAPRPYNVPNVAAYSGHSFYWGLRLYPYRIDARIYADLFSDWYFLRRFRYGWLLSLTAEVFFTWFSPRAIFQVVSQHPPPHFYNSVCWILPQSKELGRGPSEIVSTFWRKVSLCRLQRSKEAVQITIILTEEWFVLSCRTSLCLFIIKEYD